MRLPILFSFFALLLTALVAGCRGTKEEDEAPPVFKGIQVDPLALTAELDAFTDEATAKVAGTAGDIAARTQDRSVRERTLTWRLRAIPALRLSVADKDPRRAFLRTWSFIALGEANATVGPGKEDFGEHQQLVVDVFAELHERIVALGHRHFDEEVVQAAQAQIDGYVESLDFLGDEGTGSKNIAVASLEAMGGGVRSILSLPLKPFSSIDNTAEAVNNIARVGESFQRTVEFLPQVLRWQTELLLYEIESMPPVESVEKSTASVAASLDRAVSLSERLPKELRVELDAAQGELRTTLDTAQATLVRVEETLTGVQTTLDDATKTAGQLEQTATALQGAADAVLPIMQTIERISTPKEGAPPPDPDAKPFDITEYTETARAVEGAAAQLNEILAKLESEEMRATLDRVTQDSQATVRTATGEISDIVDRAVIGALIVVVTAVAGMILYRRLTPGSRTA